MARSSSTALIVRDHQTCTGTAARINASPSEVDLNSIAAQAGQQLIIGRHARLGHRSEGLPGEQEPRPVGRAGHHDDLDAAVAAHPPVSAPQLQAAEQKCHHNTVIYTGEICTAAECRARRKSPDALHPPGSRRRSRRRRGRRSRRPRRRRGGLLCPALLPRTRRHRRRYHVATLHIQLS